MLRITIELVPFGWENAKRHLGTAEIWRVKRVVGEDSDIRDYEATLSKWGRPKEIWKRGGFKGFDAINLGPWDLLYLVLKNIVGSRSRKKRTKKDEK